MTSLLARVTFFLTIAQKPFVESAPQRLAHCAAETGNDPQLLQGSLAAQQKEGELGEVPRIDSEN